jgi:hypothetical protein
VHLDVIISKVDICKRHSSSQICLDYILKPWPGFPHENAEDRGIPLRITARVLVKARYL